MTSRKIKDIVGSMAPRGRYGGNNSLNTNSIRGLMIHGWWWSVSDIASKIPNDLSPGQASLRVLHILKSWRAAGLVESKEIDGKMKWRLTNEGKGGQARGPGKGGAP